MLKKLISILLVAVLLPALPIGVIAKADALVTITKNNLILNEELTSAIADVELTSPIEQQLFIAVAVYDGGRKELKSVNADYYHASVGSNFYELSLDAYPFGTNACTLLYVWDTSINPKSVSKLLTSPDLMLYGSIVLEAEDIYNSSSTAAVKCSEYTPGKAEIDKLSGSDGVYFTKSYYSTNFDKITVPDLKTSFIVDDNTSGKSYNMWVRATTKESQTGTVFYRLNNPDSTDYANTLTSMSYSSAFDGVYRWAKKVISLNTGSNTLEFFSRTKGVIDKIIITDNTEFKPVGISDEPEYMSTEEREKLWSSYWAKPPVTPPANKHPRLYFTEESLPGLIKNWEASPISWIYDQIKNTNYKESIDSDRSDNTPGTYGTHNGIVLARIMSGAFVYVAGFEPDKAHAQTVINHMRTYLDTVSTPGTLGDITRQRGDILVTAAIVYDWCYDALTEDDKIFFKNKMISIIASKEIGWPPKSLTDIASHGGEQEIFRDLLSVGIALYDEYPLLYNMAAGRMYEKMIPARLWLRDAGRFEQGNDYGEWRAYSELWADITMQRMGCESIYDDGFKNTLYSLLYSRMPYGSVFAVGDSYSNTRTRYDEYYENYPLTLQLGATLFKDSYLKQEFYRRMDKKLSMIDEYQKFFALLFEDSTVKPTVIDNLPLSVYSKYPYSSITARTSWQEGYDSNAAVAYMDMHEVFTGNHQHIYTGDFQLYYKGLLAMNTGAYNESNNHNEGYSHRAISANTMLIYDENERFLPSIENCVVANDGGQRNPLENKNAVASFEEYQTDGSGISKNDNLNIAKSVKHYIGPNKNTPKVSYITGDLTNAYSSKLESYNRSMLFVDLNNENYPAAFIVYDRIKSSDKNFKKTWLLHSEEAPISDGAKTVIERTGTNKGSQGFGGRLVNTALLPKEINIESVGGTNGEMFNYHGLNSPDYSLTNKSNAIEAGKYRIEISPTVAKEDDTFLNAMFVTDSGNSADLPMSLIETDKFDGVLINNTDTVLFNKGSDLIDYSFDVSKSGNGFAFIAGIKPGKWQVADKIISVSPDSCSIYFEAPEGDYTITKVSDDAAATDIVYPELSKPRIGTHHVWKQTEKVADRNGYGHFINLPNPIKRINDKVHIPVSALKVISCSYTYTDGVLTLYKDGKSAVVSGAVLDGDVVYVLPSSLNTATVKALTGYSFSVNNAHNIISINIV